MFLLVVLQLSELQWSNDYGYKFVYFLKPKILEKSNKYNDIVDNF